MRTLAIVALALAVAGVAHATLMMDSVVLALQNHRFTPSHAVVGADQRIFVIIQNHDPTPETFAIPAIGVTQPLGPYGRAVIYIGPLHPGRYAFVGAAHPTTAQGVFIAALTGY